MQKIDATTVCRNECEGCPVNGQPSEVKSAVGILVNIRGNAMATNLDIGAGWLTYAMEAAGCDSSHFNSMTLIANAAFKIVKNECSNNTVEGEISG